MTTKQTTQPESALGAERSTGRQSCERHPGCRAHVCPRETNRRLRWPKERENVCYFIREMDKVAKVNGGSQPKPDKRRHSNESRRIVSRARATQIRRMTRSEYARTFFGAD
jgi:hypothetical protein